LTNSQLVLSPLIRFPSAHLLGDW